MGLGLGGIVGQKQWCLGKKNRLKIERFGGLQFERCPGDLSLETFNLVGKMGSLFF